MNRPWIGPLLVLILASAGCADDPVAPGVSLGLQTPTQPISAFRSNDDLQLQLESHIGEFGGFWVDRLGTLNFFVRDSVSASDVAGKLALLLSDVVFARPTPISLTQWRAHEGRFSVSELIKWRRQLDSSISPGMVHSDFDETTNQLSYGVLDQLTAYRLEAAAVAANIPQDAYRIRIVPAITALATLNDKVRPVVGGLRIVDDQDFRCTLGFNLRRGTSDIAEFLVASHCTPLMLRDDGTTIYQPNRVAEPNPIGREVYDKTWFDSQTDPDCAAGRRCRYSDAAVGRYDAGVGSSFGYIAKTTSPGDPSGTTEIDPMNPTFRITSERRVPQLGDFLSKVGATRLDEW